MSVIRKQLLSKKERVALFITRLQESRRIRDEVWLSLPGAIGRLIDRMQDLEEIVNSAANQFRRGNVLRARATKRYGTGWKETMAGSRLFPPLKQIAWYESDKNGGPPTKVTTPSRRSFARACSPDAVEILTEARDTIKSTEKLLEPVRNKYRALKKAMGSDVYFLGVIEGMTGKIPSWVPAGLWDIYEARLVAKEMLVKEVCARLKAVQAIEVQLTELMKDFNGQGDRWQNHLTVTWRLPKREGENLTGGSGPHFYNLKKSARGRMLIRVKGNKVTRDQIRECGQGRYEETLLPLYRKIVELTTERERITKGFISMYRILNLYIKE
jgi:hypothetical protein